jgi:nitrogen PTS system EIIA component
MVFFDLTLISIQYILFEIEIEATMHLTSFINKDLIILDHSFKNVEEVIRFTVPIMIKDTNVDKTSDDIIQLFIERESQETTAYPSGIGIPHIRIDNLHSPIISIIVPNNPLLINEINIKMLILIITDKTASKLYLNIVKAVIGMVKKTELFNELCKTRDPEEFIYRIHKEEIRILNEITVGDIMSTKYTTIQDSAFLYELGDLIETTQSEYFPVLNAKSQVIGEVTLLNYLQVGIPKYTLLLENVKFPQTIEPLEDIFRNESSMTIKEIMIPINYKVITSSSISEAVFQMIKRQSRYLPIFQDDQLVGILSLGDIFKKVIRG